LEIRNIDRLTFEHCVTYRSANTLRNDVVDAYALELEDSNEVTLADPRHHPDQRKVVLESPDESANHISHANSGPHAN
jgi:hypothetical protein